MRTIPLIAAAVLASSAANAQVYGANCRGNTLSELANCVAANTPVVEAPPPEIEEAVPLRSHTVQPNALGGAVQPSNLRRSPPIAGRSAAPGLTIDTLQQQGLAELDPLRDLTEDPTSPLYRPGRTDAGARTFVDPLAGTGIGSFGVPSR